MKLFCVIGIAAAAAMLSGRGSQPHANYGRPWMAADAGEE